MTKTNTQAHMGIGAVHDTKLRELLSEKVSEDQPPEAHALVALAKRCLKAFPTERPVRLNVVLFAIGCTACARLWIENARSRSIAV